MRHTFVLGRRDFPRVQGKPPDRDGLGTSGCVGSLCQCLVQRLFHFPENYTFRAAR